MLNIIVPTHNEDSVYRLLDILIKTRTNEKVFVLDDFSEKEYFDKLSDFCQQNNIQVIQHALNKDFGAHWNYMSDIIPQGEWIGLFASDELVDDNFLYSIKNILEAPEKTNVELISLPRVNTTYNESEEFILPDIDWNNPTGIAYPDYQSRIYKNLPHVRWAGKVHETISGSRNTEIAVGKELTIIHHKSVEKCIKSDLFYKEIGHPVYNK